ncbi:DASH complex subunit Duo1-domain-containing protein [Pseudoneurospora amorphoporcata]|uniref:DASH complex subunit DUO1 n=1 Tax=Pseudoneurospora amorphoporcata TaxID=241081 RepID=A0AAN6P0W0_9PEZI|nr:DASH complex subunit Duo1-domain-containing protein [Pseudoneurospora amorphoporcata]
MSLSGTARNLINVIPIACIGIRAPSNRSPEHFGNFNNLALPQIVNQLVNDDKAPAKAKNMSDDRMEISDEEGSSLFASPTHPPTSRAHPPSQSQQQQQQQQKTPVASSAAAAAAAATTAKDPTTNQSSSRSFGIDNTTIESREAALQRELEGVRKINQVIQGVIGTLERAKGNMGTVDRTIHSASTLLTTWTRILSQTEHNQRLLLNPSWKGATADLLEIEAEALERQREAERKAAEAERKREEARRKAEEEAERRRLATSVSHTGVGARGRPRSRSVGMVSSKYGIGVTRSASTAAGTRGGGRSGSGVGSLVGTGRTGTAGTATGRAGMTTRSGLAYRPAGAGTGTSGIPSVRGGSTTRGGSAR